MKTRLYKVLYERGAIGLNSWAAFYIIIDETQMMFSLYKPLNHERFVRISKKDLNEVRETLDRGYFKYVNYGRPAIPKYQEELKDYFGWMSWTVEYGFEITQEDIERCLVKEIH